MNQTLAFVVFELLDVVMSVLDYLFALLGVSVVVVEFFDKVGEVGLDFNVVEIWHKGALHEPGFINGARHYGYGV